MGLFGSKEAREERRARRQERRDRRQAARQERRQSRIDGRNERRQTRANRTQVRQDARTARTQTRVEGRNYRIGEGGGSSFADSARGLGDAALDLGEGVANVMSAYGDTMTGGLTDSMGGDMASTAAGMTDPAMYAMTAADEPEAITDKPWFLPAAGAAALGGAYFLLSKK